ncbi:MAG: discoidin domain-containing protein [Rhodopirellula sp.]|nr:discoidin domain-containing protein [Rhodopirellula sp.]
MRSLSCPRQIAAVVPLVFASSLVLAGDPVSQRSAGVAGISPAEIENDWLLQSTVRHAEPLHSRHGKQVSPEEDAAGACDGIKDGKWGFHTDAENRPWWQVDLGQRCDLDHALIFNRCDSVADRASRLTVLVSDDGKDFRQVYQHDGSVFYGHNDGKPLRASLGTAGRFVRIQLPAKNYLHLDEVEIFTDGGNENVALGKPARQSSNSTSAWFRVPSGVTLFFQALDADGMAVQTMRSAVYLQPGESLTCIGCHEQRDEAPPRSDPIAVHREPSKITPGPQGSWPLDYASLVQPVLERQCVGCHQPAAEGADFDLTAEKSYTTLADYGDPSLRTHVTTRYRQGRSLVGASAARANPLWKFLEAGHYDVTLSRDDHARLITWMDTYGQRQGHFSDRQADELRDLRRRMTAMLTE